ncbi:hypothetical protein SAMN05518668_1023 [Sphingobium sp. YR657]|uniref:hypothetical protein n=1 Tax=Sphingobium sp. YR657 TaxID=1884366 RepID=UPI0009153A6B|nr:hypothetical protein [Sphingobium sp. YR657]SHL59637.1 hypothetical protein SAMN05518668_1023 [Sphingobium sp. YR657]
MPTGVKPLRPKAISSVSAGTAVALPPATFAEWLSGREPSHLSTNSGTPLVAFQTWRNFKEAFAPELIAQAFEETSKALGRRIANSIDPFGGSGTTALSSQFLDVRPTTIEVNPYLADLIEAKLTTYQVDELIEDYAKVLDNFSDVESDWFPGAADTFVEPGRAGRYIFSAKVAGRLAGLQRAILSLENVSHCRLFRVLLSSIAVDVSNVVISGKGRRYRRGWENRKISPANVLAMFDDAFVRAIYDIRRYANRSCLDYTLLRGDARELTPKAGAFDVTIFSPPYPNSFDYTDVYNVELWVGGYLTNRAENASLRNKTLRSHVQIKRSYETGTLASPTLDRVSGELETVRNDLWNRSIPDMVRAYFSDMQTIMSNLSEGLTTGGQAYMVVGDSRYHGVQIPVADILIELGEGLGFEKIGDEPFRSMRASPQQGGREELVESLITLRRS